MVIHKGGSFNGRTLAFEAMNVGSIPTPPAMLIKISLRSIVVITA